MRRNIFSLAAISVAVVCSPGRGAAGEDQPADDKYRYHSFVQDGKLHVFDRKLGRLIRYDGEKDGTAVFKTWTLSAEGRTRPETYAVPAGGALPEPADARAVAGEGKAAKGPGGEGPVGNAGEEGTQAKEIARPSVAKRSPGIAITDEMRRSSLADIADYSSRLSLNSMVRTDGGDIAITVLVRNRGDKKIDVMEITVTIPAVDRAEPIRHRIVLADDGSDARKPPPPGEMVSIYDRIKAPGGGIPGRCEHEVTYIRFRK